VNASGQQFAKHDVQVNCHLKRSLNDVMYVDGLRIIFVLGILTSDMLTMVSSVRRALDSNDTACVRNLLTR
jgi:hypothetical protein